jgi:hypothetical protein
MARGLQRRPRRMKNVIAKVVATLGVLLVPATSRACPDCPSALAARAALFDERFWAHSVMVLAPLVVLGAIAALAYRIGLPEAPSRPKAEQGTDA